MKPIYTLKNNYFRIILFIIGCILVFFAVNSYNERFNKIITTAEQIKKESDVTLAVTSPPGNSEGNEQITGTIIKCSEKRFEGFSITITTDAPVKKKINYNDIISFSGKLEAPDKNAFPGAFNYRQYMKSLNIPLTCYVNHENIKITSGDTGIVRNIYDLRQSFIKSTDKYFNPECAGLVRAITTGDRNGISNETADNLKYAGVYHIVAISGLHLSIIISYVSYAISRLRMKNRTKALLSFTVCILCSVFIMIFTGYGVSVIRAMCMLMVLLAANLVSREYNSKNALIISGFVILIFAPHNIFNTAFQLSFLSTFGVLVSVDIMRYLKEKEVISNTFIHSLVHIIVTSFATTVFTLPVTVNSFGYIPLYSFIANMIILPFMGPLLGYCVIFAFMSVADLSFISGVLSSIITALATFIIKAAEFVASLPNSAPEIYPDQIFAIVAVIIMCCLTLYVSFKHGFKKAICTFLILTVAIIPVLKYNSYNPGLTINFLNTGQGDGTLIITPDNKAVMIDCGNQRNDEYTTQNVLSFMKKNNIRQIDLAFVSHFHIDHAGTIVGLLKCGKIRNLVLPAYYDRNEDESEELFKEIYTQAAYGKTKIIRMEKGTVIDYENIRFEVLAPSGDMFLSNNNMSAVIKLIYGKNSFLFTGDIGTETLQYLDFSKTDSDVLKVPHHGSNSSVSDEFYKSVSPAYAVISCGENNSYGHPGKKVLTTLKKNNINILRTDTDGTVTFTLNREKILNIKKMR